MVCREPAMVADIRYVYLLALRRIAWEAEPGDGAIISRGGVAEI